MVPPSIPVLPLSTPGIVPPSVPMPPSVIVVERMHSPAWHIVPVGQCSVRHGSPWHVPVGGSQVSDVGHVMPMHMLPMQLPLVGSQTRPPEQVTPMQ